MAQFRRSYRLVGMALGMLIVLVAVTYSTYAHQAQFDTYSLPGSQAFPEGIAYQESTGDFFVGSTTDGAIYKGNIARQEAEAWLPGATEGLTGTRGMKVDDQGRLFVSAGPQGKMYVFNTADKSLLAQLSTNVQGSFINDVSIGQDGAAYFTDSRAPNIYKVSPDAQGQFALETWLVVSPTIVYTPGFNLGGIDISDDGRYMVVAQGNTGDLFRVEMASKGITKIDLGGQAMTGADGIWLDGQTLYVVRNSQKLLVTIAMSADLSSGTVASSDVHPTFSFPTTLAKAGDRLLIVNGQFDRRDSPALPFVITSMPAPQPGGQPVASPTVSLATTPGVSTPVPAAPTPSLPAVATPAPTTTPPPVPPVVPGMPTTGSGDAAALIAMLLAVLVLVLSGGVLVRRTSKTG